MANDERIRRSVAKGVVRGESKTGEEPGTVGDSLNHLIGTWIEEAADELDRALEELERVDDREWR